MINEEVWNEMIKTGFGDLEFDWFGIDQDGYLGMFSSFNRGFIPESVKLSRIEYLELLNEIEKMPSRFKVKLITKKEGIFDDWLEYSKQGFISFDYQDVYEINKTGIYELISQPENLIKVNELEIKTNLVEKIPKFKMSFNQENGIKEQDLKNKSA